VSLNHDDGKDDETEENEEHQDDEPWLCKDIGVDWEHN
jgi:hypothetical protein